MDIPQFCKSPISTHPQRYILLLCTLNLLVMHYYIFTSYKVETDTDYTFFVDNLFGVIFDICSFLFLFWIITWKRTKATLLLCFAVTWLWSLSSVFYSRFFFHYLTLSAIGQSEALADGLIIRCIIDNINWGDLYYPIALSYFIILFRNIKDFHKVHLKLCLKGLLGALLIDIATHTVFCAVDPQLRYPQYFMHRLYIHHIATHRNLSQPNFAHFVRGELRCIGAEIALNFQGKMELDEEQLRTIEEIAASTQVSDLDITKKVSQSYNVVFILVESYMSFTSNMKVNGREVTPFLNSLKCNSAAYYNGKMKENVTIGESSDGQFIYMTGLLPLRSVITVSKARTSVLPGLPQKIGRKSRMIIPTGAAMWSQDDMCRQYAFDHLYSNSDFNGGNGSGLNDEQVFQLAERIDKSARQPFFSVVLTMSMHQPYTKQIDPTFPITDASIPKDLACYLNVCHYTDRQIERYFEHLKRTGLYDNSLIVIAADHPVHNTDFGGVSKDIPLYIVNIPSEIREEMWQGECNQIDVYTTLLDLLGVESDWYGLGHSLLSPNYSNVIDSRKWDVSEWIIRGDYFSR